MTHTYSYIEPEAEVDTVELLAEVAWCRKETSTKNFWLGIKLLLTLASNNLSIRVILLEDEDVVEE
jgi:hypothetical protein